MNFWNQLWIIAQPIVIYAVIALIVVVLVFLAGFLFSLIKLKWAQFKAVYPEWAWALEQGARMAVHAVEQMAKAGGYDSQAKLDEAIVITGQYIDAQIPGAVVDENVIRAAVEAAVYALRQEQKQESTIEHSLPQ